MEVSYCKIYCTIHAYVNVFLQYPFRVQSIPIVCALSSALVNTNTSTHQLGLMNWGTDQKYGEKTHMTVANGMKDTKRYIGK